MSLYLPDSKTLILHVPFCGGTWLRSVLEASGIAVEPALLPRGLGSKHGLKHQYEAEVDKTVAFIRDPITWYESWWARIQGSQTDGSRAPTVQGRRFLPHAYLPRFEGQEFNQYMELCLKREPGFVTRMYEWYCGPPGAQWVDHVGQLEYLPSHLASILRILGYDDVQIGRLEDRPPLNRRPEVPGPNWEPLLLDRVIAAEGPTLRRYYNNP